MFSYVFVCNSVIYLKKSFFLLCILQLQVVRIIKLYTFTNHFEKKTESPLLASTTMNDAECTSDARKIDKRISEILVVYEFSR